MCFRTACKHFVMIVLPRRSRRPRRNLIKTITSCFFVHFVVNKHLPTENQPGISHPDLLRRYFKISRFTRNDKMRKLFTKPSNLFVPSKRVDTFCLSSGKVKNILNILSDLKSSYLCISFVHLHQIMIFLIYWIVRVKLKPYLFTWNLSACYTQAGKILFILLSCLVFFKWLKRRDWFTPW